MGLCLSMCALGDRCENDGASDMYAQALQSEISLVKWRCETCNCCDTEDMLDARSGRGRLCETISAFWFDPSKVSYGSRYRCDANKRAALNANGFNVTRCSDPTYDYYSDSCCCVGCSEPVEILEELKDLAAPAAGLGPAPADRADVCQCEPEILPLAEQRRRLLATDPDAVYQERHVGECVGRCSAARTTVQNASACVFELLAEDARFPPKTKRNKVKLTT